MSLCVLTLTLDMLSCCPPHWPLLFPLLSPPSRPTLNSSLALSHPTSVNHFPSLSFFRPTCALRMSTICVPYSSTECLKCSFLRQACFHTTNHFLVLFFFCIIFLSTFPPSFCRLPNLQREHFFAYCLSLTGVSPT